MILHVGGASTGAVLITVIAIFFLIFAISFAVGPVPEGGRRFSSAWFAAWSRASVPRFIVAGTFALLLFVGSSLSGGGNSSRAQDCSSPLAPLTGQTVTEARLAVAISGMRDIADLARTGDAEGAQALFYTTDAHNVTHDVFGALFLEDRSLARELCERVIALEEEIAGGLRAESIAEHADAIADTLQTVRQTLDLSGAAPVPGASAACAGPVGAVTTDPLTEARILAASARMREAAELARQGDLEGAAAAFSGDAHNVTHDIDAPLRAVDAELAVELCESVVVIETNVASGSDAAAIAAESGRSAGLLEEAGRALGIVD